MKSNYPSTFNLVIVSLLICKVQLEFFVRGLFLPRRKKVLLLARSVSRSRN